MNLIKLLQDQVGEQLTQKVPDLLGISGDEAGSAVNKLIPTVMGFLGLQASSEEGAAALFTGLKSLPDNAGDLLGNISNPAELLEQGESMLKGLMGEKFENLKSSLAVASGLGEEKSSQLLSLAGPSLAGGLKHYIHTNDISLDGFKGLMTEQLDVLKESDASGILGSLGLASIGEGILDVKEMGTEALGGIGKGLGALGAGAAAAVTGAAASAKDAANSTIETVADVSDDILDRSKAEISAAGFATVETGSEALHATAAGVRDAAGAASAKIAGLGATAASAATSMGHDDDETVGGRSWWKLLLGAGLFVLALWQLATCSGQKTDVSATPPPASDIQQVTTSEIKAAEIKTAEAPAVESKPVEIKAEVPQPPKVEMPTAVIEAPAAAVTEPPPVAEAAVEKVTETAEAAATATVAVVESAASKLAEMASDTVASVKAVALPDGTELNLSEGSPVDQIVSYLKDEATSVPKAFILRGLNFETASSRITQDSRKIVADLAATMKAYGNVKVNLEGHTDSRGNDDANLRLSQARAAAVKAALADAGINNDRMAAEGLGETRPIADNDTQAGQLENRRVEVIVVEK